MKETNNLELIKRVKALADTGLVYTKDCYDKERYEELREIGMALLSSISGQPMTVLDNFYLPASDYPTVKVDVRGLVLNEANEILMAKEQIDGKWAIPGGWADIGYSASEVIVKEIEEETGLQAEVDRLLAVYDKRKHPHPPQPFYVYKMVFLCKIKGGQLKHGFDMEGAGFFAIDKLPELSEDRIVNPQLIQLHTMAINNDYNTYFD